MKRMKIIYTLSLMIVMAILLANPAAAQEATPEATPESASIIVMPPNEVLPEVTVAPGDNAVTVNVNTTPTETAAPASTGIGWIEVLILVVIAVITALTGGIAGANMALNRVAKNPQVVNESEAAYERASTEKKQLIGMIGNALNLAEKLATSVVPIEQVQIALKTAAGFVNEVTDGVPAATKPLPNIDIAADNVTVTENPLQ